MTDKRTPIEQCSNGDRAGAASRLTDSQFYRALASTERRRLLHELLDGKEYTVHEMADRLRDSGDAPLRLKLRHVHLPLLDEAGLVDYDLDRRTVRLAPLDSFIEDLIRWSVDESEEPLK